MKIYVASSWKNEAEVLKLASLLRDWGHEVDCFADASTGRFVFHYNEVGNLNEIDAISFLEDERSRKAFTEDKKHLDWADAVVMLHPCGKSTHLEAGYAVGAGKKLFMIGDFPKGEFDVMYGFADSMVRDLESLKTELDIAV